jgi:hypothetical protein
MLALPARVGYVREPFNFEYGMAGVTTYFPYVEAGVPEEKHYRELIGSLLDGTAMFKKLPPATATSLGQRLGRSLFRGGSAFSYLVATRDPRVKRLLIKDPLAALASEYFLREFDSSVVVIMRHPGATVASMKRLGWGHDFSGLTSQKELMKDFLNPVLEGYKTDKLSQLEEQALLWVCINTVLAEFMKRNPQMIFIKHEDLSTDPEAELEKIYTKLGLPFTEKVRTQIRSHTGAANPAEATDNRTHVLRRNSKEMLGRWKSALTPEEIRRVREITGPLAAKYYDDESWAP